MQPQYSAQQQWLKEFNSQRTRSILRGEPHIVTKRGAPWVRSPTTTQWRNSMLPLARGKDMFNAVRYKYDWHFEVADEGAATISLEGTSESKRDFVLALNTQLTDSGGYYVIFGSGRVRVVRPVRSWNSFFGGELGLREVEGLEFGYNSSAALQKPGRTCFTFIYYYGELRVFEGENPNAPGALLLHFRDPNVFGGVHQFGLGMYGDQGSTDQVHIGVQKWERARRK